MGSLPLVSPGKSKGLVPRHQRGTVRTDICAWVEKVMASMNTSLATAMLHVPGEAGSIHSEAEIAGWLNQEDTGKRSF